MVNFERHYKQVIINRLSEEERKRVRELAIRGRNKFLVAARVTLIKELRDRHRLSFPDIGILLNRNHSTIIKLYYKL